MLTTVINTFWIAFQILIGYNLALPIVVFVLHSILPKKKYNPTSSDNNEADYAILVTAYEQTHTLPPVIDSLLKLYL